MGGLSSKPRLQWMDAVRGIAIILVIVSHSVSMTTEQGVGVPEWAMRVNYIFLPYRMPILMFLSGMLLTASLRKSAFQYYEGKVRLLVWPYMIWTLIYILVVGSEYPIYHPRAWFPEGKHLWFLAYIAAYYFIAPLIKRVPAGIIPVVLIGGSILTGSGFLYFGAFFFLGRAMSVHHDVFERVLSSRWMLIGVVIACSFGIYAMFVNVEHQGQYAPLSVAGIFSSIWLVRRIQNCSFMRPLIYIGLKSLIFYVSHVPVIFLCLSVAQYLGVGSPALLIPSCIGIALLSGYTLTRFGSAVAGRWLFEMPLHGAFLRREKPLQRSED